MAAKEVILTLEGLKKLEQELELSKTVKRREVAERIKQAIGSLEKFYIYKRIFREENSRTCRI